MAVHPEPWGTRYAGPDFRSLVDDCLVGIYLVRDDRFLYVNRTMAEIFGYSPPEMVEEVRVPDVVAPEHRGRVRENLRRRLEGETESLQYAFRGLHRDGSALEVEVRGRRIEHEGEPAVAGSLLDVTARTREREGLDFLARATELLDGSLHLETTLERLSRLTLPTLADYCLVDLVEGEEIRSMVSAHVDPGREELLRRRPAPDAAAEGHPVVRVLRSGRPLLVRSVDDETRRRLHGRDAAREWRGLRSLMVAPLVARSHVLGAITLGAAESGRRFEPQDLRFVAELAGRAALAIDNARLYREAQEALRAREEVLAVVSHDLRNPLNTIVLAVSLMMEQERRRGGPPELIHRAAKRMERLIRDLLDSAAMDAGGLSVDPEPGELAPLVEQVLALCGPRAREEGVEVESRVPPDLPPAWIDPDRIHQVLSNLVGNAIKFTPEGGRVVVAAETGRSALRVSVSDTGPGIEEEALPHLFERFWQRRRDDGRGAGLGLSIAHGIVTSHGGRIWAESEPGRGTTFVFTLPLAAGSETDV